MKQALQEWINSHGPASEMLWAGGWGSQVKFARDAIAPLVGAGLPWDECRVAHVISTHCSKSINLPVYEFARPDVGLRLIARNNFYDWKLSVISEQPIAADFDGLFATTSPVEPEYTGDPLASCYFEGFPEELVFGYYGESDKKRWSAEIDGDHAMWATCFLICRSLGIVKAHVWNTEKAHRAAIAAQGTR